MRAPSTPRLANVVLRLGLSLTLVVGVAACRGLEPPYSPDQPPAVADLLAATVPTASALQVPRAKVRQGGGPAASLMLVAQLPQRFSGTIGVSGNELVTLAVNENEYGLRWVGGRQGADALAPGYYSGPPSRCAVETLMGVNLEPEAFVELVLGGAPLIDAPHDVLDRRWDRKAGRERLRLANARYEQELSFAWFDGHWQFAGASLWQRGAGEPTWLWTISHEELHEVDGHVLPRKTQIRQPKPNGRGEIVLNVSFQKQIVNPSFGAALSADPPVDGGGGDGDAAQPGIDTPPVNAGDGWDDDWDDGEGWEDGGEDGEDGEAKAEEPKPEPTPDSKPAPKPDPIPPQFVGNPTGLIPRGDLCAGRG